MTDPTPSVEPRSPVEPVETTTPPTLRAAVDARFARMPESALSWPDPDPDRDDAPEEAYSRVTDPERYAVVGARATAWVEALVDLGLATTEAAPTPPWAGAGGRHTTTLLRPRTPGALPLTVVVTNAPAGDCWVRLGVGEEPVEVDLVPDCGCDACDSGSAGLLVELDEAFAGVVAHDLVVVVGRRWFVRSRPNGFTAQNTGADPRDAIARARHGEAVGDRVLLGRPWLTGDEGVHADRAAD